MIHMSRDDRTSIASLFPNVSVQDQRSATFSPSRLNNYTNMYGGSVISSDIKRIMYQFQRRHYYIIGYYLNITITNPYDDMSSWTEPHAPTS
jgi:hypothetical protein